MLIVNAFVAKAFEISELHFANQSIDINIFGTHSKHYNSSLQFQLMCEVSSTLCFQSVKIISDF